MGLLFHEGQAVVLSIRRDGDAVARAFGVTGDVLPRGGIVHQHLAGVEIETIRTLVDAGQVVVAAGGGGIPVMETEGNHLKGVPAVIDKDFCSARLAESVDADCLIILTAVEKVAINFGKPNQEWLDELTPERARQLISEGHFAPGSMLPKVQAALQFAESKPERYALITLLEKAKDGIAGKTGTIIR